MTELDNDVREVPWTYRFGTDEEVAILGRDLNAVLDKLAALEGGGMAAVEALATALERDVPGMTYPQLNFVYLTLHGLMDRVSPALDAARAAAEAAQPTDGGR